MIRGGRGYSRCADDSVRYNSTRRARRSRPTINDYLHTIAADTPPLQLDHLFLKRAMKLETASATTASASKVRCSLVHNCGLQLRARESNAP